VVSGVERLAAEEAAGLNCQQGIDKQKISPQQSGTR
jgi:hypothetical protein